MDKDTKTVLLDVLEMLREFGERLLDLEVREQAMCEVAQRLNPGTADQIDLQANALKRSGDVALRAELLQRIDVLRALVRTLE